MSIELLDCMGDDLTVVNAARVSMHKWHEKFEGKSDTNLIRYLANHDHFTPFTHVMIQFRIKMPIFIARQWYKHQIGFSRNEVSRRYVNEPPEFFHPRVWRGRAPNVKQGSAGPLPAHKQVEANAAWEQTMRIAEMNYETMIMMGVAPEQARMLLPQAMFTEFVETGSLYGYARLVRRRTDSHAQAEIQDYAKQVASAVELIAPASWAALNAYPNDLPALEVSHA